MVETLSDISSSREAATQLSRGSSVEAVPLSAVTRVIDPRGDVSSIIVAKDLANRLLSLRGLTNRERMVLSMHFGLEKDTPPYTFQEIGDALFMTKQGVSEIQKKAIKKIRQSAAGLGLT